MLSSWITRTVGESSVVIVIIAVHCLLMLCGYGLWSYRRIIFVQWQLVMRLQHGFGCARSGYAFSTGSTNSTSHSDLFRFVRPRLRFHRVYHVVWKHRGNRYFFRSSDGFHSRCRWRHGCRFCRWTTIGSWLILLTIFQQL